MPNHEERILQTERAIAELMSANALIRKEAAETRGVVNQLGSKVEQMSSELAHASGLLTQVKDALMGTLLNPGGLIGEQKVMRQEWRKMRPVLEKIKLLMLVVGFLTPIFTFISPILLGWMKAKYGWKF